MTSNKVMAGAIVDVMILLLIAALIWPLPQARNAAIDKQSSTDLQMISTQVDDFFNINARLPSTLGELDLDEDMAERAESRGYDYTKIDFSNYELCAEFRTDTSNRDVDPGYPIPLGIESAISEIEDYSLYPYYTSNTFVHTEGRDCFEFTTQVIYEANETNPSPVDTFSLPPEGLEDESIEQLLEIFELQGSDL